MISSTSTLDEKAADARSARQRDRLTHRLVPNAYARDDKECIEELRRTITSLSAVSFDMVAAATLIQGDGRDRVERAVAELDQIMAAMRHRFYEDVECGGTIGQIPRLDSSP